MKRKVVIFLFYWYKICIPSMMEKLSARKPRPYDFHRNFHTKLCVRRKKRKRGIITTCNVCISWASSSKSIYPHKCLLTNTHAQFITQDHPIFSYIQWFASYSCVMCKRKFPYDCYCSIFPVSAWLRRGKEEKKFTHILFRGWSCCVIVGSHSKRISSFSKQRPRFFTYSARVILPYFRGTPKKERRNKKKYTNFPFNFFRSWL
jgi:hypothetical protein